VQDIEQRRLETRRTCLSQITSLAHIKQLGCKSAALAHCTPSRRTHAGRDRRGSVRSHPEKEATMPAHGTDAEYDTIRLEALEI
jgi:hypothetical protein